MTPLAGIDLANSYNRLLGVIHHNNSTLITKSKAPLSQPIGLLNGCIKKQIQALEQFNAKYLALDTLGEEVAEIEKRVMQTISHIEEIEKQMAQIELLTHTQIHRFVPIQTFPHSSKYLVDVESTRFATSTPQYPLDSTTYPPVHFPISRDKDQDYLSPSSPTLAQIPPTPHIHVDNHGKVASPYSRPIPISSLGIVKEKQQQSGEENGELDAFLNDNNNDQTPMAMPQTQGSESEENDIGHEVACEDCEAIE